MKNVLRMAALVVVMLMSASVLAQTDQKITQKVQREVKEYAVLMKLDSIQQNKMTAVLETFYKERRDAKQVEGKERGAKMKAAKAKMEQGLGSFCNAKQMEIWKKQQEAPAKPKQK